jgi:tetratricopeptide (TPR) repeat protein
MRHVGQKLVPLLLFAVAATAGAQQQACDIDEGSPGQVARAVLDIQIAQSAQGDAAASKLKDAVKLLTDGDMTKNPVGRAYELGRVLVLWTAQPSMAGGMTTRGAVGFTTNPTAPYDLIAGIDSAFTVVEQSNPACEAQTAPWRQQKGWVDLINHAIELANADKADSAAIVAKRSLQLSRSAPYGYMILAQVAQKNNQLTEAAGYYKQAIAAATDTSTADTRRQMQLALANMLVDAADTASGATKTSLLADAKAAFQALAADPGAKYGEAASGGLARVAVASGNVEEIKATYSKELANPTSFTYPQLMNAAVAAARANQQQDALQLFSAARDANPYHRDALYNLARLYMLDSAYAKGIPVVRQLIAVDPDNPDNYQLMAIAFANIQKNYTAKQKMYDSTAKALGKRANTAKSAAVVKAAVDSAAKINKFITAYGDSAKINVDSALKYNAMITNIPGKVTFSLFNPSGDKAEIAGTITNQTDAAKTFSLKIDFLDKSGNVVSSQTVSVGPVEPQQSGSFKTEGTGANITAFRYAPLN